jgi:hypothetical protein
MFLKFVVYVDNPNAFQYSTSLLHRSTYIKTLKISKYSYITYNFNIIIIKFVIHILAIYIYAIFMGVSSKEATER